MQQTDCNSEVSNLQRAKQTAQIVAKNHPNAKFIEVEDLAEISWGTWEGSSTPMLPDLLNSWEGGDYSGTLENLILLAKSPLGESPIEVERRSVPALYKCILENPGKTFAFVGRWSF